MKVAITSLSIIICLANAVPMFKRNVKCGIPAIKPDTSSDIVGGKEAIPYSWPWQTVVGHASRNDQICGGALISPQWVMTAAHCVYDKAKPGTYQVKLGVHSKYRNDERGEQIRSVTELYAHPNFSYDSANMTHDFALLKLESPVNYTDHISPVCLPSSLQELPGAGSAIFVTGWGKTKQDGPDSDILLQVSLPLQSIEKCKAAYPGNIWEDAQFCAGLDKGGKDSCNGDSGGPAVFQDPVTGMWSQIGVVSWGKGCAQPMQYGIYSKVSAFIDFIEKHVTDLQKVL